MSHDTIRVDLRHFATTAGGRDYRLVRPKHSSAGAPLLMVLHGCLQNAGDIERGTQFDSKAARDLGWNVVYPQQEASNHPNRCWNWYEVTHQRRGEGEPAILSGIVQEALTETRADPRRVYLVGISAGGAMALNLMALYPEVFAGVAVHSALPAFAASGVAGALAAMKAPEPFDSVEAASRVEAAMGDSARAVPLMVVQGRADVSVAAANASHVAAQFGYAYGRRVGVPLLTTTDTATVSGREVVTTHYRRHGSADDLIVVSLIAQLGHAWSGGDKSGSFTDPAGPDASTIILEFLTRQTLPQ